MNKTEVEQLFESFSKYNIMIIGDVMVDTYIWGRVDRISPEAPVPILTCTKRENRLGGAGNVALNVMALGATPLLCSMIGNDSKSQIFFNLLKKRNLSQEGILTDDHRITTVKTRIIGNRQHMLRVDSETDTPLSDSQNERFLNHLKTILQQKEIHAIIFQDYDKGVITEKLIREITTIAIRNNIPTLVDPKRRNFPAFRNVTLFKPNFKELVEGLNMNINKKNLAEIRMAANKLHEQLNARNILITLSDMGIFISFDGEYRHIPTKIRDIADVSGAGDTVISIAGVCMADGLEPAKMAAIANLGGGIVCEKVGVVPVDKLQLQKESIDFFHLYSQ